MKFKILLIIISLLASLIIVSCGANNGGSENIPDDVIDETALYTLKYTVNHPMMGAVSGNKIQELTYNDIGAAVRAREYTGYKFIGWSDGVKTNSHTMEKIKKDTTITAIFNYDFREMPVIAINTDDFTTVTSKTNYIKTTVSLIETDGKIIHDSLIAQIRGRGNATWNIMEKKSYRIKFDEKIDLIGNGEKKAKDWVLLANHCDQSMLRNYTAFETAKRLGAVGIFASDSLFAELYLNGKYDGVYQICEQVEVQKNRVNIDETREGTDNGYLIELDRYYEGAENTDYFFVENIPYSIKSNINSPAQVEYLIKYISDIDKAVRSGEQSELEKLIDIDSCVGMYILQEYMKNIDVGWSSFFMYIKEDGGKLYFGPPWDFDLAAGNDYRLDNGSYEGLYVGNANVRMDQRHRWFQTLVQYDWFKGLVKEKWNNTKVEIAALNLKIKKTSEDYKISFKRNFERWPIFGHRINQEPDHIMALNTYKKHADYLFEWLENRYNWLDDFFNLYF